MPSRIVALTTRPLGLVSHALFSALLAFSLAYAMLPSPHAPGSTWVGALVLLGGLLGVLVSLEARVASDLRVQEPDLVRLPRLLLMAVGALAGGVVASSEALHAVVALVLLAGVLRCAFHVAIVLNRRIDDKTALIGDEEADEEVVVTLPEPLVQGLRALDPVVLLYAECLAILYGVPRAEGAR